MSNYMTETIHPVTGNVELAMWIDNHFGDHKYGVLFLDGKIYDPREFEIVTVKDKKSSSK